MKRIHLYFFLLMLLLAIISMPGCIEREIVALPLVADYELSTGLDEIRNLRIGFVPGPYGDMFTDAVYPLLRDRGYTAEFVYYNDYTLPNYALARNQIDLNIFQHYRFLVNYTFENDVSLTAIAETPTIPMAIYSMDHESLENLDEGISVSVPEDTTNYARALLVLEDAGLIRLDRSADRTKVTIDNIVQNPLNIQIVPLRAQNLVHSLTLCDLAVIDGSFATNGGLNPSDALFTEWLTSDYFNIIAVRTEDLGAQFVKDIISVLQSDEYRAVILNPDGEFHGFQRPFNFFQNID